MRLALLLLLLLPGCVKDSRTLTAAKSSPDPIHYPRRAFYGRIAGNFAPIVRGGVWQQSAIDSAARFDVVVLDAPEMLRMPKIPAALKEANPRMILLALVNTSMAWPATDTTHLNARRYRLAVDMDALLYRKSGRQWDANLDLSNHRFSLRLAELDGAILADPNVDGLFCDWSCPTILWAQTRTDSFDTRRSGWDTQRDWDRAYREGHRIYAERLRQIAGTKFLVGNGGPSGERDVFNGWMRENFPLQNGGTWESNMVGTPWGDPGYLEDERLYVQPSLNFLSSIARGDSATDARALAYGMASASLTNGVHVFVRAPLLRDWRPEWFPIYDTNLGEPSGAANNLGYTWSRDFSNGRVIVDIPARSGVVERAK